jgi:biotin operon repressor
MRARVKGLAMAAPILVVALFGTAGCTSSSSDSAAGSGSGATKSVADASYDWDLAYAECMRAEGLDYDDPEPGGGVRQTKVDDMAAYEAAGTKCTDQLTKDRGARPVSADERKKLDKWNAAYEKTVDCLRKKGYEVELTDGGYSSDDDINDLDRQECSEGDGSKPLEVGR